MKQKRHIEVIEDGGELLQETRRWDDAKGKHTRCATKEEAHDYRYFRIGPCSRLSYGRAYAKIRAALPELPAAKRASAM